MLQLKAGQLEVALDLATLLRKEGRKGDAIELLESRTGQPAAADRRRIAAARQTNATRAYVTRPPMPATRSRYWTVRLATMGSSA